MLQLEEILGTNDLPFQTIWLAANHSMSLASGRNRITKRIIAGVNVERSCDYLCTLDAPLPLQILSSLLSGLVRLHHQQCNLHYADVRRLWLNIQRELSTSRQINIDRTRTMARLQFITLPDDGNPTDMMLTDAVHPFENLIEKENFRSDWFFTLRSCEKHYSHMHPTQNYDKSLVESPPSNILPSTRLDFDDLEFNIQDNISIEGDEGSIGSRTWKSTGHNQEMEENLSLVGMSDAIWNFGGNHEEAISDIRGQGVLSRPLQIALPVINEAVNNSTIPRTSSAELVTEDRSIIGITDRILDTYADIELLESMGVYQEHVASRSTLSEAGGLCSRRKYVRHQSASGCQIEFTTEQLTSMLSENHFRRPQERHDRKKNLEVIQKKFHELLYHPSCQVHAIELKELWMSNWESLNTRRRVDSRLAATYHEKQQVLHKHEIGRQEQNEDDLMVLTEDPEEARGQLDESAGEVFLWNQLEYLSDDSYGAGESRASSVAKSLASLSSTGLNPIYENETRPSASMEFPALDILPEHGEEWSSIEDIEFPISTQINSSVESKNIHRWADQDAYNFFSYTCRLVSSTNTNKIVFHDLFPDTTHVKRAEISQAFINILIIEFIPQTLSALVSQGLLHVQQPSPYSDIVILIRSRTSSVPSNLSVQPRYGF